MLLTSEITRSRSAPGGVLALSDGTTLKDGTRSTSGDHANQFKSAATEQGPVLGLGALASAASDEPHVEELVRVWFIRRLEDALDEQEPPRRPYGAPTAREDLQPRGVVPTRLRMYASPPAGTDSKKSPATISQRSARPAAWSGSAPATTLGKSKSTPSVFGLAPRIPARSAP
jgi:hypothetical protein